MSLNSASMEREGGAGASQGLAHVSAVPRLLPGGYAAWRPVMENTLLRAGVTTRDYSVENVDWAALVAAVDRWAIDDEQASFDHALGRVSSSATSSGAAVKTEKEKQTEKEARRGASEAVARAKRAYALLYQALSDDLRRLVASAGVSQGDAYGLWSWLEKKYQSTEQDNVGDLWDEFTGLTQGDDESFDEYKARVDRVYGLLAHAKDKPSPGLYAHRVLWKLSRRYNPAVLALKASGKLKDAVKIDWPDVVSFVNNHERSEVRLDGDAASGANTVLSAVRGGRRGGGGGGGGSGGDGGGGGASASGAANYDEYACYNCGDKGHIARHCKKALRRPARRRGDEEDEEEEDDGRRGGGDNKPAARRLQTAQRGGFHQVSAVMTDPFEIMSDLDGAF